MMKTNLGVIRRYQEYLPIENKFIVDLCEGSTPLLETCRLRDALGIKARVYLKFEGMNPTGSFKDRGMCYALSKAWEAGAKAVICASTGNTSAAASAYAARCGIKSVVLIPEGKIAFGKLSQAIQYGAQIIQIKGNFDQALELVRQIGEKSNVAIVNSINPHRLMGQMTAAFEVVDVLGDAPTYHFLPVGNAGNITAYWKGYTKYHQEKKSSRLPKMMGFQAAGSAPIVQGQIIEHPETVATAIRIGNPASWKGAEEARDVSGGVIDSVTDEEILEAYDLVARTEGYFCEPASAASIAGLKKWSAKNDLSEKDSIVCTLTGHGLKDPNLAVDRAPTPVTCEPNFDDVMKLISGE